MKRRIAMGSVMALLSVAFVLSGCERLAMKLRPEIDYELLADMVAERVDERMEMRELQKERESRADVKERETPLVEAVSELSEGLEEPEAQAESPAATVERGPEISPVEIRPEEVPLKVLTLAEKVVEIDGIDLVLVEIPAGEFLMGSPGGEGMDHEHPQHRVAITRPFYLGKYEVTQAQWVKVMGSGPSYFKGSDRPVESVSWDDVQKFIAKLSAITGQEFRLPTEAEWEYACRAGIEARYYFGDDEDRLDEYAWYSGNSDSRTHPVGQTKPNQFGLYDMLGNVWEWCADRYGKTYYNISPKSDPKGPASGKYRVLRGGGWHYQAIGLRAANRYYQSPKYKYADTGFRIAQDTP